MKLLEACRQWQTQLKIKMHRRRFIWRIESYQKKVHALVEQRRRNGQLTNPLGGPVLYFSPSAKADTPSFLSLVAMTACWGLELSGIPVVRLTCNRGMSRCVVGAQFPNTTPPCDGCIKLSRRMRETSTEQSFEFDFPPQPELLASLRKQAIEELMAFHYKGVPVGKLVIPSTRWTLRRHNLHEEGYIRDQMIEFVYSACNVVDQLQQAIATHKPAAILTFNGAHYPEAIARHLAGEHKIPYYSYEGGHRRNAGFFAPGMACACPVTMPADFKLDEAGMQEMEAYLKKRFTGDFYMTGAKFWKKIANPNSELINKITTHKQTVTIFTNVVFDTSQVIVHREFTSLFDWLGSTLEMARSHPDTLFIVRCHPDGKRASRISQENIEDFITKSGYLELKNVVLLDSYDITSSYDLVKLSKFIIVYNSTIGLESAIAGKSVICGAKTKYTDIGATYNPLTRQEYFGLIEKFLKESNLEIPEDWVMRAKLFLYYLVFKTSLDFSKFIHYSSKSGNYVLKRFDVKDLDPAVCLETRIIRKGLCREGNFFYD